MAHAVGTTPLNADQLENVLNDDVELKKLWDDGPEKFGEFIRNYVTAQGEKSKELSDQIKDQIQLTMSELQAEADPNGRPNLVNIRTIEDVKVLAQASRKGTVYNADGPAAKVDELKMSPRDFFRLSLPNRHNEADAPQLQNFEDQVRKIQNDYSTYIPSDGGFLMPESMRSEIMTLALEQSLVRRYATVIQMDGAKVKIPAVDDSSHVSSLFGGVVAYWGDEGDEETATSAKFRAVELDPKKLTARAKVNNELLQDSRAFASWLGASFPKAVGWYEDLGFIAGVGGADPLGFLNANAMITQDKESGQTAATIVWENIVKMYARMLPQSLGNAVWFANQETFPELATMALSVGTGGGPIWLNNGVEGPPARILGRPVLISEKFKALGTAGDLVFADLSYYAIGDRTTIQVSSSAHQYHSSDQTGFRAISRVDGRPWLHKAITPHNGSNTLSPFVQLQTRS